MISFLVAAVVFQTPHKPKPVAAATSALTNAELSTVSAKTDAIFKKVFKFSATPKKLVWKPGPANRMNVLAEFDRWFTWIEPKIKFLPRRLVFDPKRLTLKDARLSNLISLGFVARVGPLATAKKESVELVDFGDALGLFLARTADLTHMPNSDFTPSMQPPIK